MSTNIYPDHYTAADIIADVIWTDEGTLRGTVTEAAQALKDAGRLAPDLTIIRTVAELEALDPDTMVWGRHYGPFAVGSLAPDPFTPGRTPPLPAVVICEAADVRAARKALAKETPND